jgi:glycosyltransferase involved in cell wall biosynthesis
MRYGIESMITSSQTPFPNPLNSPQPLISVTLPNYNYGRFLAQALESILMQSYENFELLLTDDGSTDESVAIAHQYAARDSRIKAVYFEKNQGAMLAHAKTWQRATGDIVFQFSSDDYLVDTHFFRSGVEAMAAYPQTAGFFGLAEIIITETGQSLCNMGKSDPVGYVAPKPYLHGFLTQQFFVPGISSLWRKNLIDAVGGYDSRLGTQSDYYINHALPSRAGVVFQPTVVAHTRTSLHQTTYSGSAKLEEDLRSVDLFSTKMRQLIPDHGKLENEWNRWRRDQADHLINKHGRACLIPTTA